MVISYGMPPWQTLAQLCMCVNPPDGISGGRFISSIYTCSTTTVPRGLSWPGMLQELSGLGRMVRTPLHLSESILMDINQRVHAVPCRAVRANRKGRRRDHN